jgi:predicted acyltransferase
MGNILVSSTQVHFIKKNLVNAIFLLILGLVWHLAFPMNKKIWTSSYVVTTTALSMLTLGFLVWLLDMKKMKNGFIALFESFGKNPLFIFVLSGLIPRTLTLFRIREGDGYITALKWFYLHVCAHFLGDPKNGSLLYALILVSCYGFIAWYMDKRKIYIRV